jgi:thiamine biosynthesis lipoprotein
MIDGPETELPLHGLAVDAFGGRATIEVSTELDREVLAAAAGIVREVHSCLTRFDPESELSRLNLNPEPTVAASETMRRFVHAAARAARDTEGLVDPTVLPELEAAGYVRSLSDPGGPQAGRPAAPPGGGRTKEGWKSLSVDDAAGTVTREPGVRLDAGGIGKGLAADLVAEYLSGFGPEAFTVNCLGDIRSGGIARTVEITSPFDPARVIASIPLADAALATSGTTKRSWTRDDGTAAHHLIDPRSGLPASTGLVQATALAATGVEAEARAKAALLSGPDGWHEWLVDGGVIVHADGTVECLGELNEGD